MEPQGHESLLVLVKALPHVGQQHGETVCCAGVTLEGEWRRRYPVHFRRLRDNKFKRWQWIDYDWRKPRDDQRIESRRVQEDTITPGVTMRPKERAQFLNKLVLPSTDAAAARGHTLTLIRPTSSTFLWKKKTVASIERERRGYQAAASQGSFFDDDLNVLKPCPYAFTFRYETSDGKSHVGTCDDWETTATFYKWSAQYGEDAALLQMDKVFNEDYPEKGMIFAMGTHSRRPKQWLLVGVLRLDRGDQLSMAL